MNEEISRMRTWASITWLFQSPTVFHRGLCSLRLSLLKSNAHKLLLECVKLLLFTNLCGTFIGKSCERGDDDVLSGCVYLPKISEAFELEQWPNRWFKIQYMWSVGIRIFYHVLNTLIFNFVCMLCDRCLCQFDRGDCQHSAWDRVIRQ